MMRLSLCAAMALTIAACAGGKGKADTSVASTTPPLPDDVQTALAVKHGIETAPTKADSVLQANGLTTAGLDSLMFRIAADSALRAAYATAR